MEVKGFEVEGIIKVDNVRVYGLNESVIASGYPMQIETYDMNVRDVITDEILTEKDLKRAKHLGNAVPGSGHDCFAKGITVQFDLQVPEYIWRQLDRYHFIDYVSSQSKMHRILKMDIDKTCNKYVSEYVIDDLNSLISIYNNYENVKEYISNDLLGDIEANCKYLHSTEGWQERISSDLEWTGNFFIDDKDKIFYRLRHGEFIEFTKENLFNIIAANIPSGIMLTARMTTNYLQLKSIVNQRSNHKMQEWRLLCDYFKTLPMFDLVCK